MEIKAHIILVGLVLFSILSACSDSHQSGNESNIDRQDVLEQQEEVGLATVYRVLTQFETSGLVIRHNFEGGRSVFELNDESHHDHMVCVECGKVFEFSDATIEKRQYKAAEQAGFVLQDHSLYLYGICQGMSTSGKCSMRNDV